MTTDWHTWIGKGDPENVLDPANWKDAHVPRNRGSSVLVPSGSRIGAIAFPPDMMLDALHVEPDPKGTPPEKCTHIGQISADQIKLITDQSTIPKGKP